VCIAPINVEMIIVDISSFYHARVLFCGCTSDPDELLEYNQLLSARLFPATFESPKTAFTFGLLDLLVGLSGRGKTSSYDFHHAIRTLTDACDLSSWPVSC
jgi:hypothetical protein